MYDCIIIGGGPAGLSAAIYARRAQLDTLVIEKDYGGLGVIAVTEQVNNYPGMPEVSGYDLGEAFHAHAESLGAQFREAQITGISRTPEGFTLHAGDSTIDGKCVIWAAGASHRRLHVPGEELLGVSFCAVCDGAFYQGKTVAVIGGGDTALEDALYLSRIAQKVYLIHRRGEFRANQTVQQQLSAASNIELVLHAECTKILGDKRVNGLRLLQNGTEREIALDGVFPAIGSVPNTDILQGFAELDAAGYLCAGEDGVTSVPGFFAAGDVRTKKLRQVVTAAADGACCIQSAEGWLRQSAIAKEQQ